MDQDLEGALKALEGQDPLDPREMAIVKYTPSIEDPPADFADEVYYPPVDDTPQQTIREKILAPNAVDRKFDPLATSRPNNVLSSFRHGRPLRTSR